jgi:hypothetical protein
MILALGIATATHIAHADSGRKKLMIGGQVMVTAEPAEDGGRNIGINVLPLLVEYAVTGRFGVRLNSIVNAQVAGDDTGLAHMGGGLTIPVYLERSIVDDTVYAGPFINVAYNPLVEGTDLTMAAEVGIRWRFGYAWSFNLIGQVGATRFFRQEGDSWTNHIGVYPGVGYWF